MHSVGIIRGCHCRLWWESSSNWKVTISFDKISIWKLLISFVLLLSLTRVVVFVIACLLVGLAQAVVGFRTHQGWRRLQGMILMTLAVIVSAFINTESKSSKALYQPFLLIVGAIMVIVILVLQMYYLRLFKRLCGQDVDEATGAPQIEIPQDRLKIAPPDPADYLGMEEGEEGGEFEEAQSHNSNQDHQIVDISNSEYEFYE